MVNRVMVLAAAGALGGGILMSPAALAKVADHSAWATLDAARPTSRMSLVADGAAVDAVYRGPAGGAVFRTWSGGAWSPAVALRGDPIGVPGIARAGDSLAVFIRGHDGALWVKRRGPTGWSSTWSSLGGVLTASPAAVGWSTGRIDVVVRGVGDVLQWRTYLPSTGWAAFQSLGGKSVAAPAIAASGPGTLDIAYTAADTAVWLRSRRAGAWGTWTKVGGSTYDAPALARNPATGQLLLASRAADNTLALRERGSAGWSPPARLGGSLVDAPGIAVRTDGTVSVAAPFRDGAVWTDARTAGQWSGWQQGWAVPSAPPVAASLAGKDLEAIPTSSKVVALTFDAGANADAVPSILATLERKHVRGTFFLTGNWVNQFPLRANQITEAGNRVGNHSISHPDFTKLTDEQVRAQVAGAATQITAADGADPHPLFRFPFGARTAHDIALLNAVGYACVRWTVDTLGWKGTSGGITTQIVVSRVLAGLRPGEIVLMHVGSNPDDHSTLDADALPTMIDQLRARGYSFVTLDALPTK